MIKIKHQRTADCVVAGFRWHKDGHGDALGSLLLGLYDDEGRCTTSASPPSFTMERASRARRRARAAAGGRPRRASLGGVGGVGGRVRGRGPAGAGRHEPLEPRQGPRWEPLRPERVAEVAYDHLQGDRFRHGDDVPALAPGQASPPTAGTTSCETPAYELERIFGA